MNKESEKFKTNHEAALRDELVRLKEEERRIKALIKKTKKYYSGSKQGICCCFWFRVACVISQNLKNVTFLNKVTSFFLRLRSCPLPKQRKTEKFWRTWVLLKKWDALFNV